MPFISVGWFILRYFILFDAVVNGTVSLISLSGNLLLVYKSARFLCISLCPATLLNSLMSSSSFLVVYLGSSVFIILISANSHSFTSSFSIWISLIYIYSLISAAGTSKLCWMRGLGIIDEAGHHFLFPDLGGNSSFSLLSMILTVGLSYVVFIMLKYIPLRTIFWRVFIISGCWFFLSKAFFWYLLRWSYFFHSSVWQYITLICKYSKILATME